MTTATPTAATAVRPAVTIYPADDDGHDQIIVIGDNPSNGRPRASFRVRQSVGPDTEGVSRWSVETWTGDGWRAVYESLPAATDYDAALTAYRVVTAYRPHVRDGRPMLVVHADGTAPWADGA